MPVDQVAREAIKDPSAILPAHKIEMDDSGQWIGPASHLASERERLSGLSFDHFDVRPVGVSLGAEISGLRLESKHSGEVIDEIRQALCSFKVLIFRDQPVTAEQHVSFARCFGELEKHPFIPSNTQHPELVRFEKSAEVAGYENQWHHDVTWRESPSMGAILHAIEVPEVGGDTLFCDMHAAYMGLNEDLRNEIDGLFAIHDYMRAFGHQVEQTEAAEMRQKFPEVIHPVVRTHPETQQRCLFLNRIFTREIIDLEPEKSAALIHRLTAESAYPEYQLRVKWEPDTLVFWDNRSVQHYASSDYWPLTRIMERASIVGDRPT